MSYALRFGGAASKDLEGLHPRIRDRVMLRLKLPCDDPRPHGSEHLKGNLKGLRRLRVGEYRASYTVDDDAGFVLVVAVGPRGAFYEQLRRRR